MTAVAPQSARQIATGLDTGKPIFRLAGLEVAGLEVAGLGLGRLPVIDDHRKVVNDERRCRSCPRCRGLTPRPRGGRFATIGPSRDGRSRYEVWESIPSRAPRVTVVGTDRRPGRPE